MDCSLPDILNIGYNFLAIIIFACINNALKTF